MSKGKAWKQEAWREYSDTLYFKSFSKDKIAFMAFLAGINACEKEDEDNLAGLRKDIEENKEKYAQDTSGYHWARMAQCIKDIKLIDKWFGERK